MSDMPKRFLLRGRALSIEELEEHKQEAARRLAVARQPGEGIHEYVRRVSHGDLQIIRTVELDRINNELSTMQRELRVLRQQVRVGEGDLPLTATEVIAREQALREEIRRTSRVRTTVPVDLTALGESAEERVMVGGPMHGRILRFREDAITYHYRDTSTIERVDRTPLSGPVSQSSQIVTRNIRYERLRHPDGGSIMLCEELLNRPRAELDEYVLSAYRLAGVR